MKLREAWQENGVGYVSLTQGKVAKVDIEDLPLVGQYNWHVVPRGSCLYAENRTGVGDLKKSLKMHRLIMGLTNEKADVDHINHDTLDNRRSNLRVCEHSENSRNCIVSKNNKIGLKGVSFEKYTGKYKAQITVNYKGMNLGRYDTPEEAHKVYIEAAKKFYGEFAHDGVLANA